MLNRFNYPNTGIRYPNILKSSEWSIDTKVFKKMKEIIDFTNKNIDLNKDITDLIKEKKEREYIAYIEEICSGWIDYWIIFKDINNFSLLNKEINRLILKAKNTCNILDNLKVPNKFKNYNKYFYKYFNLIVKCKNVNSSNRESYFNEANENLKKSLSSIKKNNIKRIKECTDFLYKKSINIK